MLSRVPLHLKQTFFHESVLWSLSIDELTGFWMHIVSSFLRARHSFSGLLVDQLCLLSGSLCSSCCFQKCHRNSGGRCLYNSFVWDLVQSIMYISSNTVGLEADGPPWGVMAACCWCLWLSDGLTLCEDSHKVMTGLIVMLASEYGCGVFSAASWICLAQAPCLYLDQ